MRDWRLVTLALLACLAGQSAHGDGQGTAVVEMEGHSHVLDPLNWRNSTTTFDGDDVRFYLTADGQPVSINFNLSNTGILSRGSAVFTLPDFNQSGSGTIELSF